MSQAKEDNKKKKRTLAGWLSWLLKLMLKISAGIMIFIIIFSLSLYILFQFEGFRGWVSGHISSIVSNQLEAKLEFEDIHISLFKGLGLDNVRMITAGDTLAQMNNLYITFQIKPFFSDHILITNLTLDKPIVKLLKSKDGSWNLDHIVKPTEEDTTTTEAQNLTIELRNLELRDAVFIMYDSTSSEVKDPSLIDFSNLYLDRLNIELSAKMETLDPDIIVELKNISFIEKRTFFNLKSFNCSIAANPEFVRIDDLNVETDKSKFSIDAGLDSVNIFSGEGLDEALLSLELDAERINIQDVYHFADIDYQLSKETEIEIELSGILSEINIDRLDLKTGNTWLNLSGTLYSLTQPDDLAYDITISDSRVYYKDLINNIPRSARDAIQDFNFADIRSLKAKGNTSKVEAGINITNKFGNIKGKAGIDFKNELIYHANIHTEKLNIGGFIGDDDLKGNINAHIIVDASGSSLEDLKGKIKISATNSSFSDYSLTQLEAKLIATGESKFVLDTLYLGLIKTEHGSFENLFSETKPFISSSGSIDLSNDLAEYDLNIQLKNINAKNLFNNKDLPGFFSGRIEAEGKGFDLDELEAHLHIQIEETMFDDRSLMPFDIDITFRRDSGDYKELLANSELFSIFLSGEFSYSNFFTQLSMQGTYLEQFLTNKINSFYQSNTQEDSLSTVEKIASFEPITLSLEAKLYDLSPLSPFLDDIDLYANASFDIDLDVNENKSELLVNNINISSLQIRNPGTDIIIKPTQISGALFMSIEDSLPKIEDLSLNLVSDFGVAINDLMIGNPSAKILFKDSTAQFHISSTINDLIGFSTNGDLTFLPDKFLTTLDVLEINYPDKAKWKNTEPVTADITYNEYNLRNLVLQRDTAETIKAFGNFSNDSLIDMAIIVENFPFYDINKFMPDDPQELINEVSSGLDSLDLRIKGSLAEPDISLFFKTDDIVIREKNIGYMLSEFKHDNKNISGFLSVLKMQYAKTKTLFEVNVNSLPFDLYLSGDSDRKHSEIPIDVKVKAESLPVVLMEAFASGVSDLNGFIDINAKLTGQNYDELELVVNLVTAVGTIAI